MSTIPDLTTDALWDLLATRGKGVLATIKRDGRPQLSNISYQLRSAHPAPDHLRCDFPGQDEEPAA